MANINEDIAAASVAELPALLTIHEAAKALRVSKRTITRMLALRRLRAAHLSVGARASRTLIPRSEIARLLAETLR